MVRSIAVCACFGTSAINSEGVAIASSEAAKNAVQTSHRVVAWRIAHIQSRVQTDLFSAATCNYAVRFNGPTRLNEILEWCTIFGQDPR
jgi:hypothetical protein